MSELATASDTLSSLCSGRRQKGKQVWILIIYVLIVVVGEAVVVGIGLALDRTFPLASLPVSLTLFFAVLAFGWPLAVRWTEPKHAKRAKLAT
jgi:uncharacterized membrane protein YphA (DoxX/SURF4 family)